MSFEPYALSQGYHQPATVFPFLLSHPESPPSFHAPRITTIVLRAPNHRYAASGDQPPSCFAFCLPTYPLILTPYPFFCLKRLHLAADAGQVGFAEGVPFVAGHLLRIDAFAGDGHRSDHGHQ